MSDEETVVEEPKEEPQAASEATDAQVEDPSVDELLKEFEGGDETDSEPTETEPDVKVLAKKLQELEEREQRQQVESELNSLAGEIRGDLPDDVFDNDVVRSWLEAQARKDQRLQKAFMNRHNSPTQWRNVVKGMAKQFQGKFSSLPNREATEDAEAVNAAVRGASTKAPEQDEISHEKARGMTDDQLEEYLKQFS